ALFLQPVKQPPRPDKFRSENTQSEEDGEPSGAWRDDHDDPQGHDGKAKEDLQKSLRLLHGLEEHRFDPSQPANSAMRTIPHEFDAAVRLAGSSSTRNSIDGYVTP